MINSVTEMFRKRMIVPDPVRRHLGRLSEEMASKKTPEKVMGVSQVGEC